MTYNNIKTTVAIQSQWRWNGELKCVNQYLWENFLSFSLFLFYCKFPILCNIPTVKTYYKNENCKKSDLTKLDKKYQRDSRKSSLKKKMTILFLALFLKLNADVGRIYRRWLLRFVFSSTSYRSKCSKRRVINRSKRIPIECRELSRKAIGEKVEIFEIFFTFFY